MCSRIMSFWHRYQTFGNIRRIVLMRLLSLVSITVMYIMIKSNMARERIIWLTCFILIMGITEGSQSRNSEERQNHGGSPLLAFSQFSNLSYSFQDHLPRCSTCSTLVKKMPHRCAYRSI